MRLASPETMIFGPVRTALPSFGEKGAIFPAPRNGRPLRARGRRSSVFNRKSISKAMPAISTKLSLTLEDPS